MKRVLITVFGSVQGVGFRPFVFRLATRLSLVGDIKNTNNGVRIDIQGGVNSLERFQNDLVATKPERAQISEIVVEEAPLRAVSLFEIAPSESLADTALALLPDTSICSQCLQELFDSSNRRYHYPFLHCMTCGPRFTLFLRMPYDRDNTTMIDFTMCEECQSEYGDPENRRFYSQTNCCPQCGPKLSLLSKNQELLADHEGAIDTAVALLHAGNIVAVKNTGGYLLLVDATNEEAVKRLRTLKKRPKKPFALLMPDMESIKSVAHVESVAEEVLTSPAAPIVLLSKRGETSILAPSVAPDNPYYGVMLPHNALQLLLLLALKRPLIATSGNLSDAPLCITEEEAFTRLSPVADAFLVHNRRIKNRLDDSIVQIIHNSPMILRRARGYIPYALSLPPNIAPSPSCLLAVGGHLKNTFAWYHNQKIYSSQHIGDLDSTVACRVYEQEVKNWEGLLNLTPEEGVSDQHPDYYSGNYLEKRKLPSDAIQHHKAHVWSGMADQQLSVPLLAFAWDGTGFGEDQTIWGGEAFLVTKEGMQRFATLFPFRLPGGEKAVREPRRSALGALHALFGSSLPPSFETWRRSVFTGEELSILSVALTKGVGAPVCTSMGRLFDVVSALLDCCLISQFEGDAALSLEALARGAQGSSRTYTLPLVQERSLYVLDWRPLLEEMFEDKVTGIPISRIALGFHGALVRGIVDLAKCAQQENVLLTGGVMQNKLLAEQAITALKNAGFTPIWHHRIPPNDGGIAVGQIFGKLFEKQRKLSCV